MPAEVAVRTIHAKRGRSGWSGPGIAIYAVICPVGGTLPSQLPVSCNSLSQVNVKKYGWEIISCGTGYWNRTGPRSMYGRAVAEAERVVRYTTHMERAKVLEDAADVLGLTGTRTYKAQVIADSSGQWCGNGLTFPYAQAAWDYVRDLEWRWLAVRQTRVIDDRGYDQGKPPEMVHLRW